MKSGEFFETYRLSFSCTFSVSDSSTELVHPDGVEWVFDVLSFVLNTLITLLLSVGDIVYDFDMLSVEEIVNWNVPSTVLKVE